MTDQRDFAAMFGGANENVDWQDDSGRAMPYLAVPEPTDDLETTARKLAALSQVVEQGKSLAVRTGFRKAAHQHRDPVDLAKLAMTPAERRQYEVWSAGVRMPDFDWGANRKEVPAGQGSQKRFEGRARAMGVIWGVDMATPENASWLTSNMNFALPLVIAVSKVEAARRELLGGGTELDEMELAEVQTAHKIVAVAMDNMNQVFARLRKISADINHSKDIIQAREHAIKSKMPHYKKRKDPINAQRTFLGQAAIGGSVDYSRATGGGRAERTNLLGGSGIGARVEKGGQPKGRANNKRPRVETGESSRGPVAPEVEMLEGDF
ncbi:hypothetical protein [Botryosphaeria dothidea bipartite mycovirus 1]|nr:hypothetical protein [Botryosphaeria dothidea bipartite mycovirus 1]